MSTLTSAPVYPHHCSFIDLWFIDLIVSWLMIWNINRTLYIRKTKTVTFLILIPITTNYIHVFLLKQQKKLCCVVLRCNSVEIMFESLQFNTEEIWCKFSSKRPREQSQNTECGWAAFWVILLSQIQENVASVVIEREIMNRDGWQ